MDGPIEFDARSMDAQPDLGDILDAIHRVVAQMALRCDLPARFCVPDQDEVLELSQGEA